MNFTADTITITDLELKALAKFAGLVRYDMDGGIWFDFDNQTAMATDGKTLLYWGMPKAPSENLLRVPSKQVRQLLSLASVSPSRAVVIGWGVSHGLDIEETPKGCDRAPAEKALAMPDYQAGTPASVWRWQLNAELLARLEAVQSAHESTRVALECAGVTVEAPRDPLAPTLFRVGRWTAVIMPIRNEFPGLDTALRERNAKFEPAPAAAPALKAVA